MNFRIWVVLPVSLLAVAGAGGLALAAVSASQTIAFSCANPTKSGGERADSLQGSLRQSSGGILSANFQFDFVPQVGRSDDGSAYPVHGAVDAAEIRADGASTYLYVNPSPKKLRVFRNDLPLFLLNSLGFADEAQPDLEITQLRLVFAPEGSVKEVSPKPDFLKLSGLRMRLFQPQTDSYVELLQLWSCQAETEEAR